jgi:hypothetical protein
MSNFTCLWEVRDLMTQALRLLNEMDTGAPAELRPIIRPLQSALKSIDQSIIVDPFWPGLSARA